MLFTSSVLYPELLIFFIVLDRRRFDRDWASMPSNIKTASEFLYKVKSESLIMFYYHFPVQLVICMVSKSFYFCFQPKVKLCIKSENVLLHIRGTGSWNSLFLFLKLVLLFSPTISSPILMAAKPWDMIFSVVQYTPSLTCKTKAMTECSVWHLCVYVCVYIFLLYYYLNAEDLRYWRA